MAQASSDNVDEIPHASKLIKCAQSGSLCDIKSLIRGRIDLQTVDHDGSSLAHHAVSNPNTSVLVYLLNSGIPLEARNNMGATPLLQCAAEGTVWNLELLMSGANVQARDRKGKKALHYAVRNCNATEMVKDLLKGGLFIEERDSDGQTPLHCCAQYGTLQTFKTLIRSGASIKTTSHMGETALHFAAANQNSTKILEFLLTKRKYIEKQNETGCTALHHSIMFGNIRNTKLLVEKGANLKATAMDATTCLHLAAASGDTTETLQYLLQKGASINAKDSDGRTPLHSCAAEGNLQKMKFLVEKGADIFARDKEGGSALHFAAGNKQTTDIMQYLLDNGIPVDLKDKLGRTPLYYSVADGSLENVSFLCDKGADLRVKGKRNMTLLHSAAMNADGAPIIQYLLGKGLPIDVRDDTGSTPLRISRALGFAASERILLENGAKSNEFEEALAHPAVMAMTLAMMNQKI